MPYEIMWDGMDHLLTFNIADEWICSGSNLGIMILSL